MCGQTNIGRRLDSKSNACPMSVLGLSNGCPSTKYVHTLSNRGTMSVKTLSKTYELGRRIDRDPGFVYCLSNKIFEPNQNFMSGRTLDKDKTWTNIGLHLIYILDRTYLGLVETMVKVHILGFRKRNIHVDRCWTTFVHGQTVDKVWILGFLLSNPLSKVYSRLILDNLWAWINLGQSLDFCIHTSQIQQLYNNRVPGARPVLAQRTPSAGTELAQCWHAARPVLTWRMPSAGVVLQCLVDQYLTIFVPG